MSNTKKNSTGNNNNAQTIVNSISTIATNQSIKQHQNHQQQQQQQQQLPLKAIFLNKYEQLNVRENRKPTNKPTYERNPKIYKYASILPPNRLY